MFSFFLPTIYSFCVFLFIQVNSMFYFGVVLEFGKGDGMKAPGPLCPEVALQKAAVVFFVTSMPRNLTRKDNS